MKIVLPLYGLGNVMFQYAFLCELRTRNKDACYFAVFKRTSFEQQGYELERLFKNVKPYKGLNKLQKIFIRFIEFLNDRR